MTRIALALIAVLALAGCSSAPAPAPAAQTTVNPSNEAAYLTVMDALPAANPRPDHAALIELAHDVCTLLDEGQTPDQIAATLLTTGVANEAGTRIILRASVVTYCPTHEDVVPARQ